MDDKNLSAEQQAVVYGSDGAIQDAMVGLALSVYKNDPDIVVSGKEIYRVGEEYIESKPSPFMPSRKGMAGNKFIIVYNNGTLRDTTNLWHQATVPEGDTRFPETGKIYGSLYRDYDRDTLGFGDTGLSQVILPTSKELLYLPAPLGYPQTAKKVLAWDDPRAEAFLEAEAKSRLVYYPGRPKGHGIIIADKESHETYVGEIKWCNERWLVQETSENIVLHETATLLDRQMKNELRNKGSLTIRYPDRIIFPTQEHSR